MLHKPDGILEGMHCNASESYDCLSLRMSSKGRQINDDVENKPAETS
jgi:hypothetical protein